MTVLIWFILLILTSGVFAANNGTNSSLTGELTGDTKTFYLDVTYFYASPDGFNRTVVGLNNTWPCPNLNVDTGDRVLIYVHNSLPDQNTSLHVHGLFQHGSSQFDGPEMISQCPIPPGETMLYNFTVPDQVGSYWYHSHTKGQYGDGFRGAFIIHDKKKAWDYDEEVVLTVSEWYHELSLTLDKTFLNRYNPTGAEPIPDNLLFNDTFNGTWHVKPDTTYLLRIINIGAFVSQYLYVKDHQFTVVEIDGIKVKPNTTEVLYITVAQRYTVLFTTKNETLTNYAFIQAVDGDMLDVPGTLAHNVTNQLVYDTEADRAPEYELEEWNDLDDFYLEPLTEDELFDHYDYQITVNVSMNNLNNGVNYAFFNNLTFAYPKVPTLFSAISAGNLSTDPTVYGSNTNAHVLQKDDIIELVLNNQDTGKHPFHLHGHTFQVVYRGPDYSDEADPIPYDPNNITEPFPEHPMIRDTVYVRPQSSFVIRFKADNPGVWFFHCHIEWHLSQGLALVLIEAPDHLNETLSDDSKRMCEKCGIPVTGNAAANSEDFLNLQGENVQIKDLPSGFTAKGIVAMVFSIVAGLLGLAAITVYGLSDIKNVEGKVAEDLDIDLFDKSAESGSADSDSNKATQSAT